ncbi:MAG: hypothetical protein JXB49_02025 [Bacteroidales bacterium]|nr:hypothetical protein [Bacteroidales bacterium]
MENKPGFSKNMIILVVATIAGAAMVSCILAANHIFIRYVYLPTCNEYALQHDMRFIELGNTTKTFIPDIAFFEDEITRSPEKIPIKEVFIATKNKRLMVFHTLTIIISFGIGMVVWFFIVIKTYRHVIRKKLIKNDVPDYKDVYVTQEDKQKLVSLLISRFKNDTGIDVSTNENALSMITNTVEWHIEKLFINGEYTFDIPYIYADNKGPRHLSVKITLNNLR